MRHIFHQDQIFPIEATASDQHKIKESSNNNIKNSSKIIRIYFAALLLKNNFMVI